MGNNWINLILLGRIWMVWTLPVCRCLLWFLYQHLYSQKETAKKYFSQWSCWAEGQIESKQIFYTDLTCSLLDLRNRRPRRLPSGIRTRRVTAFSSSGAGSWGNDASFAANCLSYSCQQKVHCASVNCLKLFKSNIHSNRQNIQIQNGTS